MNSSFDLGRWILLVKQHWIENKKRYLLSIVAMAGVLFMWFFFIALVDDNSPMEALMQRGTYYFLLFISGCFFASQFFRELGSRSKGINYLLLPASSLEKVLVSIFYVVILFFLTFTAVFYIVDVIMVTLVNAIHPAYTEVGPNGVVRKAEITNVFGWFGVTNGVGFFMSAYFAFQAAFLLGSVYFEKYSFIKTVISLFFILLVLYLGTWFMAESIMPNGGYHKDIGSYQIVDNNNGNGYLVELPEALRDLLIGLFKYGFPFFFWVVTYFRLKEKEV
jgi:hypothetical protein